MIKKDSLRKRQTKFFDNKLVRKLENAPKTSGLFRHKKRLDSAKKSNPELVSENSQFRIFENLPELIKPELAAAVLGISIKTIYDWRYRFRERKVPNELFLKINRSLLIRTNVLRQWIASQNPSLREE